MLLFKGLFWDAPSPGSRDPSLLIGRKVELIGRLQADARVFETSCSALIVFLNFAGGGGGAQPSLVRAVLMGATAHLIGESDQRSLGAGDVLLTLSLM